MVNIEDIIKSKELLMTITFQELISIKDNLIIPDIQVDLNEDKVIGIKESYLKNPKFFVPKSLITIAKLQTNDITKCYLVDGQHRVEAIERLIQEDENITNNIRLALVSTSSRTELILLFKELNIDSLKCPKLSDFEWIIIEKLKDKIKNKYSDLPKTISNKKNIYTVGEFLDLLKKKNILEVFNKKYNLEKGNNDDNMLIDNDDNYVDEILKKLEKKNKEFFRKAKYLEILNNLEQNTINDDYKFQKIEKDFIEKHTIMFFKRNNFIDWLVDNTLEPEHEKMIRINITDEIKNKVWTKEFEARNSGNCPIWDCKNILDRTVSNSWQCGHLKSVKNGGSNELKNFKPICPSCNSKMSDTNWEDYVKKKQDNKIVEDYFVDEGEETKCKKTGCKIKINKNNFHCVIIRTKEKESAKPYCKKCYDAV